MLTSFQRGWVKRKEHGLDSPWNKGKNGYKNNPKTYKGQYFNCLICDKSFYRIPLFIKLGRTKYCSQKCYGQSKIGTENFSNPDKGHTVIYKCEECGKEKKQILAVYNKAKHHFCSSKCANTYQGKLKSKENHWNWKGGITEPNHAFRNSTPYKEWRMKVFQRDRFTCIKCGYRSHKPKDIVADHIKPFHLFPELRLEVSNGRTFCIPCDKKFGYNFLIDNLPQKSHN